MGLLAQTNAEIRDAERRYRKGKAEAELVRRPIFLIDRMVRDLEELNLRGMKRVPLSYEARLRELDDLLGRLPAVALKRESLKVKIGIAKLMEALFAVQEALFVERRGDAYPPDEDDLPPDLIYAA